MNNLLPHPDEIIASVDSDLHISDIYNEDTPDLFAQIAEARQIEEYDPKDYLVVIPSVRPIPWEYFHTLSDLAFFVCDDSDGKVDRHMTPGQWNELRYPVHDEFGEGHFHFPQVFLADREFTRSYVGEDNLWLFPNHNPSVKNIGLYYAVKEGYKAVILLDDDVDCRERHMNDFLTIKRAVGTWDWASSGRWMNTLSLITTPNQKRNLFARGYPYEHRMDGSILKKNDRYGSGLALPFFNEGLWTGHPDINGVDKLEMIKGGHHDAVEMLFGDSHERDLPWFIDPETKVSPGQVLLRQDQNLPLSIMNCQIDAAFIPAFWQPPDYQTYNSYRVRRHDDVWSMYLLRKIMARFGADITVGDPLVYHDKQADIIGEILSEHYTNLIQPHLTTIIDDAAEQGLTKYYGEDGNSISASQVALAVNELSMGIRIWGEWGDVPGKYLDVLQDYFKHVQGWSALFGGDINPLT